MCKLHGLPKPTTTAPWKALEGKTHLLPLNSFSKSQFYRDFAFLWEGTHFRMDGVCGHLSMGMLSLPRPLTQLFVFNNQPLFCCNLNL
jgi:hypothetical protein